MTQSVSVQEKTLERWSNLCLTYRYHSHVSLWWPTRGEDIEAHMLPTTPGKAVQLELKTTTPSGTGLHGMNLDLGRLNEDGPEAFRRHSGETSTATSRSTRASTLSATASVRRTLCEVSALSSRSRRAVAAKSRRYLRNPCALVAAQWPKPAGPVASWIGEDSRFCQRRPALSQRTCAGAQPSGPRLCAGLPHARPRGRRRGGPGPPRRRGVRARDRAPVHLAPDLASRPRPMAHTHRRTVRGRLADRGHRDPGHPAQASRPAMVEQPGRLGGSRDRQGTARLVARRGNEGSARRPQSGWRSQRS
jgi:hypothetical protein